MHTHTDTDKIFFLKTKVAREMSQQERALPLFQAEPWRDFWHPYGASTAISSSRRSAALFCLLLAPGTLMVHRHACRQNTHT